MVLYTSGALSNNKAIWLTFSGCTEIRYRQFVEVFICSCVRFCSSDYLIAFRLVLPRADSYTEIFCYRRPD